MSFVFRCNASTLSECLARRSLSCVRGKPEESEILNGSVIFLLNEETQSLIGPFTATEEEKAGVERGAWTEKTSERDLSGNIRVKWENLHEIDNAVNRYAFLKEEKICKLNQIQTQQLLTDLDEAPLLTQ